MRYSAPQSQTFFRTLSCRHEVYQPSSQVCAKALHLLVKDEVVLIRAYGPFLFRASGWNPRPSPWNAKALNPKTLWPDPKNRNPSLRTKGDSRLLWGFRVRSAASLNHELPLEFRKDKICACMRIHTHMKCSMPISISLSISMPVSMSIDLFLSPSINLSICLSVCLPIYLRIQMHTYMWDSTRWIFYRLLILKHLESRPMLLRADKVPESVSSFHHPARFMVKTSGSRV